MSTPPATTAHRAARSAPSCAAASMPRARPDTTANPASPDSRARSCGEFARQRRSVARAHHRDHFALQQIDAPSTEMTGGGGSSAASPAGKSGSQDATSRPPNLRQRLRFARASSSAAMHEILGAAAALRQPRQFLQRRRRGAETRDQVREGDRTHILACAPASARRSVPRRQELRAIWRVCADARFLATQQAADIFAMHEEDQHRQEQRPAAHNHGGSEEQEIDRRQGDGDQGGQRRDAPDQGRRSQVAATSKPTGQ